MRGASDQASLQRGQYSDFLNYVANKGAAYRVFNETPSRPRGDGPMFREVPRAGPYTSESEQLQLPCQYKAHHESTFSMHLLCAKGQSFSCNALS